jgi:hypothetical protein
MEQCPNNQEIVELLAAYCRGKVKDTEDGYLLNINNRGQEIRLTITNHELTSISQRLGELDVSDETALYDDNGYEIVVREESTGPMRRIREDKIQVCNEEIGVTYELSPASDEYFVWLLKEIITKLSLRNFRFGMFFGSRIDRLVEDNSEINLLKFIRSTSFRLLTLKIKSEKKTLVSQFIRLTHSFLFHIGYNLDVALVPQRLLEEIARRGRIYRMRRSRAEELDPPRRFYTEDIVQHYLFAISTDNPVMEYLSYYHVLEHFFESVFNDDLIESVKSKITNPGFSYKRPKDISKLVNFIKNSLQIRSEKITFSENEALKLCLLRFVDLNELKENLMEYDETLVEYYKRNKVGFSGGVEFDLEHSDRELILKDMAKRIYDTRNSLVHSKDGEKSKYTPFRDDRVLVKELPLMRFISEKVILSKSTVQ